MSQYCLSKSQGTLTTQGGVFQLCSPRWPATTKYSAGKIRLCTLCHKGTFTSQSSDKSCSKESCFTLTHSFPDLFQPGTLFSLQDTCYNAVKHRLGKCWHKWKHKTLHLSLSRSLWMHFWMGRYVCLSLDLAFFVTPAMKFQKVVPGRRKDWGGRGEHRCILESFPGFEHICLLSPPKGIFLLNSINLHAKPFSLLLAALLASKLCPPTRTMGTCSGVLANQLFEGQVKNKNKPPNALICSVYWTFPPWLNSSYQWLNKQLA